MAKRSTITMCLLAFALSSAAAGERSVVSLKDFSNVELKMAGIQVPETTTFQVKALGGGGDHGGTESGDEMFAYAWIINADTRKLVWRMDVNNTSSSGDDREFDGELKMEPGSYEVYFSATTFASHSTFKHFRVNVDHRESPLFGKYEDKGEGVFEWFKSWWSDDITKDWNKRSKNWGIEMFVDDATAFSIKAFDPPKELSNVVLESIKFKENKLIKQGFQLSAPMTLNIYAIGEGRKDIEVVDGGWIVDTENRKRVWEMDLRNTSHAGGAKKNLEFAGSLTFDKGNYVLYYITDDSHSAADWNSSPPYDPLHWGITISVNQEGEKENFKLLPYIEDKNVIVRLTKAKDFENLRAGFGLKDDINIRIYAFGERSNSRRLHDYGYIMDAKTRNRVWTMDVDRTHPAGGASKNRYVDEIVPLPKGNYIVGYITDDSHAYNEWNASPPFDPEHYGITVMGVGERFNSAMVADYVEARDKNIIAQISQVGDDADLVQRFTLDRTTKVRLYAIGEGMKRHMYDYGWIEDEIGGNIVWEMTYSMSQHAGGARKNKMENMTMLLDKGEYKLRYRSDDSHSYNHWNDDPPDDQHYWGITLFKEDGTK